RRERSSGRSGSRLAAGPGYPLIDVLAGQRERGTLDLEDDRRTLHGDPLAREEAVRMDRLEEPAAPFRPRILAGPEAPGWQAVAAAYALRLSDGRGHDRGRALGSSALPTLRSNRKFRWRIEEQRHRRREPFGPKSRRPRPFPQPANQPSWTVFEPP